MASFRLRSIKFKGIWLHSTVVLWTRHGANKRRGDTLIYVGPAIAAKQLEKDDVGDLEYVLEGDGGGTGSMRFTNVIFHERDEKGCLNFFLSAQGSCTPTA